MAELRIDEDYQKSLKKAWEARIKDVKTVKEEATQVVTLASLQTFSIQTHREKYAVRALGQSSVRGYSRGPRTIAGSMICTVFNEHVLARLMYAMGNSKRYGELDELKSLVPDQLPPIDLTVIFANEYGSISRMGIYGVEFVNDSKTFSIEDLFSENPINFVARDVDLMTSVGRVRLSDVQGRVHDGEGKNLTATDLMLSSKQKYSEYLSRLGIRRRLVNR
jgi:hypothetical protein